MTGGDLFSYLIGPNDQLRHLPEYEALFICFQILKALKYLHSLNIAHRDLKVLFLFIISKVFYNHLINFYYYYFYS